MHFSPHPRKKYKNLILIKVKDTIFNPLDLTRYLGIIIDKKLNWRFHLHHIESKIFDRISLLRFLSKSATEPNDKTMLNIYQAIVRTIITYEFPVLLTASDKSWERMKKLSTISKIKQYSTTKLTQAITTAKYNNDKTLRTDLQDMLHQM
jgi:hypothetical protein